MRLPTPVNHSSDPARRIPLDRSISKEEAVIRERFPVYVGLPVQKVETMRPLPMIVDEIVQSVQRL
jgi:hypothetical protein